MWRDKNRKTQTLQHTSVCLKCVVLDLRLVALLVCASSSGRLFKDVKTITSRVGERMLEMKKT